MNEPPLDRKDDGMDLIKSKMEVVEDLLVTVLKSNNQRVSENTSRSHA
jgi:hypothetical protein